MYITWVDGFSVNVKEIDEQHKILITRINELHEAMKVGKGKENLETLLENLIAYAQEHFSKEEAYMVLYDYSEYLQHKGEHKKFVKKILKFQSDYKENKMALTVNLMKFLNEWLVEHILKVDRKYSLFFNKKGLK